MRDPIHVESATTVRNNFVLRELFGCLVVTYKYCSFNFEIELIFAVCCAYARSCCNEVQSLLTLYVSTVWQHQMYCL